jgi:hypothetical protein
MLARRLECGHALSTLHYSTLPARQRQSLFALTAIVIDRSGLIQTHGLGAPKRPFSEIEATRRERERLAAEPKQDDVVDPEDALAWLASLGTLWRETSDEGRRQLALATFERISVASGPKRASHRIVSLEITDEAERRGLVLALPASIEVTMVGDTGFEPVTSRM